MVFAGDLFYQLQGSGIYEYVLPFLLIFAVTFAILEKVKILGNNKKSINAIVAIIIGLIFVTQFSLVYTLNTFLPKISLFIIIAVMVLILFGILGAPVHDGLGHLGMIIGAIVALFAVYWALSPSLGFEMPYWVQYNFDMIIAVVIIIIIIALVIGGSQGRSQSRGRMTLENLGEALFGNRGNGHN